MYILSLFIYDFITMVSIFFNSLHLLCYVVKNLLDYDFKMFFFPYVVENLLDYDFKMFFPPTWKQEAEPCVAHEQENKLSDSLFL